jgi:hypothetical protein
VQRRSILGFAVKLHAVLTGVSRTGHKAADASDRDLFRKSVVFLRNVSLRSRVFQDLHEFRALQSELPPARRLVFHSNAADRVGRKPFIVLVRVACVDYQQIAVVRVLINKDIVHGAAVFITYGAVPAAAGLHSCQIVRDHML